MARRKRPNEEQVPENPDNSDDTFGLPEVDYEPLRRDTPPESEPEPIAEAPAEESEPAEIEDEIPVEDLQETNQFQEFDHKQFAEPEEEEEKPAVWPKVLGILLLLIIVAGAGYYFGIVLPKQKAAEEKERRELQAIQEAERKKEADRLAEQQRLEEERKKAEEANASATPEPGTIETLSGRSGKYYVVVASSIDGDLIMDFAKKLAAKGVGSKIIPPFGKTKFHRLAVAEGDTYETAQTTADGMKGGDYGEKVWVVKY